MSSTTIKQGWTNVGLAAFAPIYTGLFSVALRVVQSCSNRKW